MIDDPVGSGEVRVGLGGGVYFQATPPGFGAAGMMRKGPGWLRRNGRPRKKSATPSTQFSRLVPSCSRKYFDFSKLRATFDVFVIRAWWNRTWKGI